MEQGILCWALFAGRRLLPASVVKPECRAENGTGSLAWAGSEQDWELL
ncbi:MAG: hypothetical protein UGF45_09055 [Massilioclostridium sp.]|nr:hypothetical protein [Massilioclostridium sp.]MEE1492142.1 hypothetical protein [Massilioclostridium sp.]